MNPATTPLSMFALALAAIGSILFTATARAEPADGKKEPPQFRVLDSQEVDLGSRSIIYNRVETPVLKPQPTPIEQPTAPLVEHVPTPEELAEMQRWEEMNYVSLFLSCTVYDSQLTEVRFRDGETDVVFWSTINFNYLSQLFDLQIRDSYYSVFMAVGDLTREEFHQQNEELHRMNRSDLVSSWPTDLLAENNTTPSSEWRITSTHPVSAEAQRAIEDLHKYFDTNREALIAQHAEREAARIAHEQWLKDNPPQPKDTVIQFFPIRSDHSSTEASTLESAHSTSRE